MRAVICLPNLTVYTETLLVSRCTAELSQSSSATLDSRRPPPLSMTKNRSETLPFEMTSPSPASYSSSVDSAKGAFFNDSVPTTPGGTHLVRSFTLADPVLQRQRYISPPCVVAWIISDSISLCVCVCACMSVCICVCML